MTKTKAKTKTEFKTLTDVLFDAVSTKRPSNSLSEAAFVGRLVKRLPVSMIDEAGNIHVDLRELSSPPSRSMFTCHTDTVHSSEGPNKYAIEGDFAVAVGAPLGADDGAGIALLCHMIENKVPGLYVMFRSEESGGVGSRFLAENHIALLEQFDRAIAFDRKGVSSVITHQGSRCCSDKFGEALAEALSTDELLYATDNTGVFTDTANFVDIISECTNLSCAYEKEHSDKERLNVKHLKMLAAQIIKVDWEALPVVRSTIVEPPEHDWRGSKYWDTNWAKTSDVYDDTPLRSLAANTKEAKALASDLKLALELSESGYHSELSYLLSKEHTTKVHIDKFTDANYYISELNSGADPCEILDEIFWEVR